MVEKLLHFIRIKIPPSSKSGNKIRLFNGRKTARRHFIPFFEKLKINKMISQFFTVSLAVLVIFHNGHQVKACEPPIPASNPVPPPPDTAPVTTPVTTEPVSISSTPEPTGSSNWPCQIHQSRSSRIFNGTDAEAGSFPFYVAVKENYGGFRAGVIIDSYHVLTQFLVDGAQIAYGIETGQSFTDIFQESNPNIINVDEIIAIPGNSDLILLRLASHIPFGPLTSAVSISDCSGPSKPIIGESLAYYGLGYTTYGNNAETMQVKCGEVVVTTAGCINIASYYGMEESFCMITTACSNDRGGPIVAFEDNQVYLVGIQVGLVSNCYGKLHLQKWQMIMMI